jgi:hypothetical protein
VTFLLDVNVLIALLDPAHLHHHAAHEWFAAEGRTSWASCATTQTAVLRIVGNPRYPNCPGPPGVVAPVLSSLVSLPGHAFWADGISPLDRQWIDPQRLLSAAQVTDTYLLALAAANGGQLATFDRRLAVEAVAGGAAARRLI